MIKKCKKFVSYTRVSTIEQGISGLGLDAQREAINEAVEKLGGTIEAEFIEVASGKNNKRPILAEAIKKSIELGCGLVVAKLDRLGRNAAYLFAIRDNVKYLHIADKPNMTTLEYGIYATMAQDEAERISQRTKAALAIKKASGYKFGKPENLTDKSRQRSIEVRKGKAMQQDYNLVAKAIIEENLNLSLAKLAEKLNKYNLKTAKGKQFTACTVQKIMKMYGLKKGV